MEAAAGEVTTGKSARSRQWLLLGVGAAVLLAVALWAIFGPGTRDAKETWYW